MKIKVVPALLFILVNLTHSNLAMAEGKNPYIGIFAGSADTSLRGTDNDFDLDYVMLQLGVWVTDDFSLEGRMGWGNGTDSTGPFDLEIENFGGVYGAYHWYFGDHVSVYGIAGWSDATLKKSGSSGSIQGDDRGLSYGAGIKLSILNIEYLRLLDTSDTEVDAVSVGLQYTFD